jgi:type I restriction enzyme M protein
MAVSKASLLSALPAARLREIAEDLGLSNGRTSKATLVASLARQRRFGLDAVLGRLSLTELRGVAASAAVNHRGLPKADLVAAVAACVKPESSSSPRSRTMAMPEDIEDESSGSPTPGDDDTMSLEDGSILDYITNRPVKDTPKEAVRQRIARAQFHEYGISVDDMESDFKMVVGGRRKKVDLAIFDHDQSHEVEHLRRIVICEKEPTNGRKSAYKMRSPEEAEREFEVLKQAMTEAPNCKYGLWTNGLEFFFFDKEVTRFDVKFRSIGDWPQADETIGTREVASAARMRRAEPEMLRTAFRRCHNFIHGNEGMSKDTAFWQFLYLIFCKMYDERQSAELRRFWAGPTEQFDDEGRRQIKGRIVSLFEDVKKKYKSIFRGNEEIALSDRALSFMVSELAKYDFGRTDVDAKGAAYQEIVGANLRGDRGQYFTPRGAIKLMVKMLDPKPNERVLDPACGTGGFLVATIAHILEQYKSDTPSGGEETSDALLAAGFVREFVEANLFGCDFDPALVRATTMNLMMAAGSKGNVFHLDSLSFPAGHLEGVDSARKTIPSGSMDIVMTNPPFGSDIPITDPSILSKYELAAKWEKGDRGEMLRGTGFQTTVAPEVLFIQRAMEWLRPGGRMGIVLPNGILGNPGDVYIRQWILRHCWVLASVDLPVETFIVEANVNILTSLLFLKKKSQTEIQAEDLGKKADYPVFMAVAEKVGFDRRGVRLYKRSPDGEEILQDAEESERIRVAGKMVVRTLRRKKKIPDDDLPLIAEAYWKFREKNEEPGA